MQIHMYERDSNYELWRYALDSFYHKLSQVLYHLPEDQSDPHELFEVYSHISILLPYVHLRNNRRNKLDEFFQFRLEGDISNFGPLTKYLNANARDYFEGNTEVRLIQVIFERNCPFSRDCNSSLSSVCRR